MRYSAADIDHEQKKYCISALNMLYNYKRS